jgi:hypothetical protein
MAPTATAEATGTQTQNGSATGTAKTEASLLADMCVASDTRLQPFRAMRTTLERHIAGPHYGHAPITNRQSLPMLYTLAGVMEPSLSFPEIRTYIRRRIGDSWLAGLLQAALDERLAQAGLAQEMRDLVGASMVGPGLTWTSLDYLDYKPATSCTSLDDYVFDPRATKRRRKSYSFEGCRFRISYHSLMDTGTKIIDAKAREIVEHIANDYRNLGGKASTISGMNEWDPDGYDPQIELTQLFLPDWKDPRKSRLVWMPGLATSARGFILDRPWYGHPDGPMDFLSYATIGDNVMPIPPMYAVFSLFLNLNLIASTQIDNAIQAKRVGAIDSTDAKLINTLLNAPNGHIVEAPGAKVSMLDFFGAGDAGYKAMSIFEAEFNKHGHNYEQVGGTKAASPTLGQDEMLQGNSNVIMGDMARKVKDCAGTIAMKHAWYLVDEPSDMLETYIVNNEEYPWNAETRKLIQKDWNQYRFSVKTVAAQGDSQSERFNRLAAFMEKIITPLAQMQAQRGKHLNADVFTNAAMEQIDLPEVHGEIWEDDAPQQNPAGMPQAPAQAAPVNQRRGQVPNPLAQMAQPSPVQGVQQ